MNRERADSLVMRLVTATRKEERHKLANPRGQESIYEVETGEQKRKLTRLQRRREKIEDAIVDALMTEE